ncbi:DUF2254 domain-containing protein [Cryobacterium sp. PH31-AA6]|uniref:DUF2254 domain-containing protein n=1 Tax=Cryobacterium sp. PH31-AA6 TaxID=3046205 RepID=UPI0024BB8ED6|nr:DUF2254 domain-containing protein [Cryobacterium sp. PH31-AA6]MDJ0323289.1 DUF2254 domain-containing protein [Cryobacterium sp. PH31-AA6]
MRSFLLRTRESFWFLPAVFGIVAIIVAETLVFLDRTLIDNGTRLVFLDALSASSARSILSIIGTSMITVAGTSFSITISVLATTSSTYGPRLVRNFLADRANQIVLAVFTSTFLYALVVLRSVRSAADGSGFVPSVSIHAAVLIGIVNVAVLVFFIHHIADSVQITTLQRRVQDDLLGAIALIYPAEAAERTLHSPRLPLYDPAPVTTATDGYVEQVDLDQLERIAENAGCLIDVVAMPGDYVVHGEPLVQVSPSGHAADVVNGVRAAFTVGTARTPRQDVRFALQQLVEVAVRGLASGSNDPYTAVTALDLAATALVPLLKGPSAPTALTDADGNPRVLVHWPDPDDLIRDVFAGVTTYGLAHPLVVATALRLADRLLAVAGPTTTELLNAVVSDLRRPAQGGPAARG